MHATPASGPAAMVVWDAKGRQERLHDRQLVNRIV
jgi:hypothetical protein